MAQSELRRRPGKKYKITCKCKEYSVFRPDLSRPGILGDLIVDLKSSLFECAACGTIYRATDTDMNILREFFKNE